MNIGLALADIEGTQQFVLNRCEDLGLVEAVAHSLGNALQKGLKAKDLNEGGGALGDLGLKRCVKDFDHLVKFSLLNRDRDLVADTLKQGHLPGGPEAAIVALVGNEQTPQCVAIHKGYHQIGAHIQTLE